MRAWHLSLLVLVGTSLCQGHELARNRTSTSNGRLGRISRQLQGIKWQLQNLDGSSYVQDECETVLGDILTTLEDIRSQVSAIQNIGNVIERVDLGMPGRSTDTVLIAVPPPIQECFDELESSTVLKTAGQVTCMQELLWTFEPKVPAAMRNADNRRVGKFRARDGGKPRSNFRIRREYRTLSRAEREAYHAAVRQLIQDGTLATFARLHAGAGSAAHSGPAFLPWHRAFLTSYEEALRAVNPNVSLPYWDNSMDYDMENPVDSIVWTEDYLGNGMGQVIIGPFTGIMTLQGPLEREYGERSRLIDKANVATMMTQCHFRNISAPTAVRGSSLEGFHNNVHVWVGGDMSAVGTAAYDPVFYMHHCYIDYLWEKFREHQVEDCGVDPVVDYYDMGSKPGHGPDDPMTQMPQYTNSDGAQNFWTQNIYNYEKAPSCENNCGNSPVLYCNEVLNTCIPRSRFDNVPSSTPPVTSTTPGESNFYYETTPHCNHEWPWCHQNMHLQRPPPNPRGPPLPPLSLSLHQDLEQQMRTVPRNRGPTFMADQASDGRTVLMSLMDEMATTDGNSGEA